MGKHVPKKYKAMKFDGDDKYSWAVFYHADVAGHRSPVFSSMGIRPLISGCTSAEARHYINSLLKGDKDGN